MTDQPHGDEAQDNVGTGAEISTENEAAAIFYDGSDGVPPSGATLRPKRRGFTGLLFGSTIFVA